MTSSSQVDLGTLVLDPTETMSNDLFTGSSTKSKEPQIDPINDRFPTCIVWTPLPFITQVYFYKWKYIWMKYLNSFANRWFLPFIGHMGIATSQGQTA